MAVRASSGLAHQMMGLVRLSLRGSAGTSVLQPSRFFIEISNIPDLTQSAHKRLLCYI